MKRPAVVAAACLVTVAAACGHDLASDVPAVLDALPRPDATTTVPPSGGVQPTTTTSPSQGECAAGDLATASLRPDDHALDGDAPDVEAIRDRGILRVGVDENTLGFSSRDPKSGEIEGFEVELAKRIAAAIFGAAGADRIERVPVVTKEKIPFVENDRVDMTISANSMSCDRWERVAFSTEYYTAHQEFLVREDSSIRSPADLDGATVCVTAESSSERLLRRYLPEVERHPVLDRTGCLVALQEGEVDAYFGHDSFLYGMMEQDPSLEIRAGVLPPELADLAVSHYGIAIGLDKSDLVRFVNAVLEDIRQDDTWAQLHDRLEDELGVADAAPPQARYRD
jgi:polar amino acid transport system substrate-binding protein